MPEAIPAIRENRACGQSAEKNETKGKCRKHDTVLDTQPSLLTRLVIVVDNLPFAGFVPAQATALFFICSTQSSAHCSGASLFSKIELVFLGNWR